MYTFTHRARCKEERMNPSHVPVLPPWKHAASSQAHLCIVWLNFMYHKAIIIAESTMLLSLYISFLLLSALMVSCYHSIWTASCFHPDIKLLIVSQKRLGGLLTHWSPLRWTRLREHVWERSTPLLSIGPLVTMHRFNPPGVISVSVQLNCETFLIFFV